MTSFRLLLGWEFSAMIYLILESMNNDYLWAFMIKLQNIIEMKFAFSIFERFLLFLMEIKRRLRAKYNF